MNCAKIRNQLLSEYADGELKGSARKEVEKHLESCSECREYYNLLQNKIIAPFNAISPVEPPEGTWENIQKRIYEHDSGRIKIREIAKNIFVLKKPALALVSILVMMIIGTAYFRVHNYNLTKQYINEQIQNLAYLQGDLNGNGEDFGTSIEEYFL